MNGTVRMRYGWLSAEIYPILACDVTFLDLLYLELSFEVAKYVT